jgi:tetratricopeptide (TPR) repeat protein
MTSRLLVALFAALTAWGSSAQLGRQSAGSTVDPGAPHVAKRPNSSVSMASDTALAELAAGRYWHAARMLRAEGVHAGGPEDVLALAHAEAGWENWPGVLQLLDGAGWLASGDGAALYHLGRALEEAGRWSDAATAFAQYSELVGRTTPEGAAALSRRARSLWRAGEPREALASLGELVAAPAVRSWSAVEMMIAAAAAGDTAGVASLLVHVVEPGARAAVWRAEADARLAAGDSSGAADGFRRLHAANEGGRRVEAATELGRLRLAAGDTAEARALLLEAFEAGRGPTRGRPSRSWAWAGSTAT